jgi:hypothetical protein
VRVHLRTLLGVLFKKVCVLNKQILNLFRKMLGVLPVGSPGVLLVLHKT